MRMLTALAGATLLILAATPVLAGDPGGGGHHGGGGHQPRPPCCGHPGGANINVNVNASARAFASASASSHFNARAYNVGAIRSGAVGGGVIYSGGGYGGGDIGGYYGGPVYYEAAWDGYACASAPFGYLVSGFGRDGRRAPSCGRGYYDGDHGGRYGYSERHDGYAESRYESRESYEEYEAYEYGEDYGEARYAEVDYGGRDDRYEYRREEDWRDEERGARDYDRGYMDGRRDCDCRPDGRDGEPYFEAPLPPPPLYREHEIDTARPYEPLPPPPRHGYRQEPGERG